MSRSDVRSRVIVLASVVHLISSSIVYAQQPAPSSSQVPSTQVLECRAIPANVVVQGNLAVTVQRVLDRSRTFRQQCGVIAVTPGLTVTLRLASGLGSLVRARAEISRFADGTIRALIEVPVTRDLPELLAHEFEHVLEHVDGLQLRVLARFGSGVREIARGTFETTRAIEAGRTAASEMDRFREVVLARVPRRP